MTKTRTIPEITPTKEQWEIIDRLYDPYIKASLYDTLYVYDIKDDEYVRLYVIDPDGGCTVEELIELGYGWRFRSLDDEEQGE